MRTAVRQAEIDKQGKKYHNKKGDPTPNGIMHSVNSHKRGGDSMKIARIGKGRIARGSGFLALAPHFLQRIGYIRQRVPEIRDHIHRRMHPHRQRDAITGPRIQLHDLLFLNLVLHLENHPREIDLVLHADDHHPLQTSAKGIQAHQKQIMRQRSLGLLPCQHGIDRGSNRGIDEKRNDLVPIT